MFVKDIMNRKVIYCYENDSLYTAMKKLLKYNISGMPVIDKNKKLKGIISITDIIDFLGKKVIKTEIKKSHFELFIFLLKNFLEENILEKAKINLQKVKVKDIMKKDVKIISEEKTIGEAIEMMMKYDISRLIVVKNSKVVGIVTKTDILKYLLK
jgi:CBS domain-containing protein